MGKRTTTRHKEDNTFRFQTFEEKLRQISVNVNLSIRDGRAENLEGNETYFCQEIEKWVELNRTESFADLLCKIGTDSRTLAQILIQKDRLAKVLLEHVENGENVASFKPAFAIIIALARDLGEEFYPHFQDFFKVIVKIVKESKDTTVIEAGFKCYAYLSKFLRRQILKDLNQHMKQFSCFLDPKLKTYVMIFACEAFSIVAGKFARDHPEKFLRLIFGTFLRKHPEHAVGVGTLLFAIFKGVGGTLKIQGPGMHLNECFKFLKLLENSDEKQTWTNVLSNLTLRLLNHANAVSGGNLIELVEGILSDFTTEDADSSVNYCLSVYVDIVEYNNAGKITNLRNCATVLCKVSAFESEDIMGLLSRAVLSIIESKCSSAETDALDALQPLIRNLLKIVPYELLDRIDGSLRGFRSYFRMFLEPVIEAYTRVAKPEHLKDCPNMTVYCLSEALVKQEGLYQLPNPDDHYFTGSTSPMYYFSNQKRLFTVLNASSLKGVNWNCCLLMDSTAKDVSNDMTDNQWDFICRFLLVFSRLNSRNCESCLGHCVQLLQKIITFQECNSFQLLSVYYLLQAVVMNNYAESSIPVKELLNLLKFAIDDGSFSERSSLWGFKVLDVLVHFITTSKIQDNEEALKEFIKSTWSLLTTNLQSGFRMVRSLSLSILRNSIGLLDDTSEKSTEMLDKFLQLEDMSVMDPKFSSLGKSILTECKVVVASEAYENNVKLICLKYTLGLMYTNFSLIWGPCVEVICDCGKNMDIALFWDVFGKHFQKNMTTSKSDSENMKLLPSAETFTSSFTDPITHQTFALPKATAGSTEFEEKIDVTQYKINLWQSLKGQPITKREYKDLKDIVDSIIVSDPTSVSDQASGFDQRERALMIVPVLQFLETCDLVNVNHELWENSLKYLTYSAEVQKAAWKFLFAKRKNKLKNYKEDIDEVIKSESLDCIHKFRIDAVDVTLNKQYENETLERRSVLMDILIRVLIGKERVLKGEKRTQVLRFLAGCTEDDAKKYLDLTVGAPSEAKQLPPKIIEIKINKMTSALRIWRYKFPKIVDQIVKSACDLACAVNYTEKPLSRKSFIPNEQIPDEVFEEQKKAALKAGRLCVVAFFTFLPRLDIQPDTLSRIFDVFIWPTLEDLTVTSVGSVSWILKLFLVWSTHERFHILFTKCKDGAVQQSPMWRLFDLLESNSTVMEVKKYILGIILNLANPPEVPEESSEPVEEFPRCTNAALDVSGAYAFETSESTILTGLNVILLRKDVILNLFQDTHNFKKFATQTGGGSCLSLISLIADFGSGREDSEKLCNVIVDTFQMYKGDEESLFNSIVAVGKLLSCVENPTNILQKLAPHFAVTNGRRLRTALVDTLVCIKEFGTYEIIKGINEWTELAADTPNFTKRQESFEAARKLIEEGPFDMLFYTLVFYNCIHNIIKEEDIGMRNAARNLLNTMAASLNTKIAADERVKPDIHKLIDSVILPKLRSGMHQKEDKRLEDLYRVLYAFVSQCCNLHGTFKELSKLFTYDIVEGLCDIQIHLRTRAMNRLLKVLTESSDNLSPAIIQGYLLPLANHNLFDEARLAKNFNELIDSSIEVLKVIMGLLSHDQYFSYLNKLLDDPKKNTRLAKQYERVLIAIMDAFHFDLSLGCSSTSRPKVVINVSRTDDQSVSTDQAQDDNVDDDVMEEKEEFTIPTESSQVTMTLVPQAAAIRCLGVLKSSIIPKLRKFLNFEERATHKLSKSTKTIGDDVVLRIPCTIALVKLLKRIPKAEGQNGIRSIIPSITAGLRNGLVAVRNTLRKTLLNVIKELGTSHLKVVIRYLKSSLQRGYQKHVLNYTVGYLLRCLEPQLKVNPEHVPVKEILPLCEEELYGVMLEEKELAAIRQKTREASKGNAPTILKVCSKCVSTTDQLNSLIDPAIRHITEKKSVKVAKASRQWLNSVSEGLSDNNAVNHQELLHWLVEVIKKDGTPMDESVDLSEPANKKRKLLETPKDPKLIPVLKKKTVADGRLGGQSLLTEFAFSCLYSGLNKSGRFRDKLWSSDSLHLLDGFVPYLADGIKATSKQVNVVALRSVTLLLEFDLPSFKKPELIDKLQRNGFITMNNHCYKNTTDSEITNATFKFLTAFFVRFSEVKVVLQDFELMLKCIQSYLTDGNCSSSALTLLKGVLENKYKCSVLPDLMQEIFQQCITSYYQHINEGCRQAYITYLNNYLTNPKELYIEVQLILRQLDYEHENGRLTAAEILVSLIQNMPEDCFEEVKELIFLKLLATLDKEKRPKVRERLGDGLKNLFKHETRKSLSGILLNLFVLDKHIPELDTFFLLIGLLIDDPKIITSDDLRIIVRRINDVLDPSLFTKLCSKNSRITQQIKDYVVFQAAVTLKKALGRNSSDALWSTKSSYAEEMETIFCFLRDDYLLYEHEWVPLISVEIISIVINKLNLTEETKDSVVNSIQLGKGSCVFLQTTQDLQQMLIKLWDAMRKSEREDVLAKGAFSLVQLISLAARLESKEMFVDIIGLMRKSVNGEVVKNPGVFTIRTVTLGCYRGVAKTCPPDAAEQVVEIMTRVAVRELTDDNVPSDLKTECEKLVTVLRDVIGNSEFNAVYAKVNDFFHRKRNLNRAKKKENVMLHPGLVRKRPKKANNNPLLMKKKRKTK